MYSNHRPPRRISPTVPGEIRADVTILAMASVPSENAVPAPAAVPEKVPYSKLFRYATPTDILCMVVGLILSAGNGVTMPAFSILFGALLDRLNTPGNSFSDAISNICKAFLIVGGVGFVCSLGELTLMDFAATRQVRRIRNHYFRALLRQVCCNFLREGGGGRRAWGRNYPRLDSLCALVEIAQDVGWFDLNTAGDLGSRLAEYVLVFVSICAAARPHAPHPLPVRAPYQKHCANGGGHGTEAGPDHPRPGAFADLSVGDVIPWGNALVCSCV